jgi:Flp pilus assembly protein TadD
VTLAAAVAGAPKGVDMQLSPAAAAHARWSSLLAAGDDAAARAACAIYAGADASDVAAEGESCLASVILRAAKRASTDDRFPAATWDEALVHLRHARSLRPCDVATHADIFDVLLHADRFADVPPEMATLAASCPSAACDAEDVVARLLEIEQLEPALATARILEPRCRDDARLVADIGAVLTLLQRDNEAESYLVRAVAMDEKDPVARWRLARHFELTGDADRAATEFARWSEVETDDGRRAALSCAYASFLEHSRHDLERACKLAQVFCPEDRRTACATQAGTVPTAPALRRSMGTVPPGSQP